MKEPQQWHAVSGEQRQTIEDLFHEALSIAPDQRNAFVERQGGLSDAMKRELLGLLATFEDQERSGGWNKPLLSPAMLTPEDDLAGLQLGSWRLIRLLGQGGMGAVYLASRSDGEFEQKAAVKLIAARLATGILAERFREERQILARLEHPHIARLLDGGTTPDGDPYLVMEYVDGQPITKFCETRKLGLEARLQLFLAVCAAVQYAHQNLVVHRDIKPDNILVTGSGEVKLVDFGTSKLLADASTEPGLVTQLRMITPRFASPEQILGDVVTTLTDVYSLGVLLCCLLAGDIPYKTATGASGELERAVLQEDPLSPSAVASARGLPSDWIRRLRGDFDAIVLKALEKNPRNRYESVEKLAADITRSLAGLPVSARQGTLTYRASRFFRRHWVSVAAALTVAGVLIAASLYSFQQARNAEMERQRTLRVNEFVTQLLGSPDPSWYSPFRSKGREVRVVEVLEEADRKLDSQWKDDPAIAAELRRTLGNTYNAIGLTEPARRNLREALQLQRKATGTIHPDTAASYFLLGQSEHMAGNLNAARAHYEEALRIQKILGKRADPVVTMKTTNNLAIVFWAYGDAETATRMLTDVVAMSGALADRGVQSKALALGNLALAYDTKGDIKRARQLYEESIAAYQSMPGKKMMELAISFANLGIQERYLGREESALRYFDASIRHLEETVGLDHPLSIGPVVERAASLARLGNAAAAEKSLRASLASYSKHLPPGHYEILRIYSVLGEVLIRRNKLVEAEQFLRRAYQERSKIHGPDEFRTAQSAGYLGQCLLLQGRRQEGEALLRKAIADTGKRFGANHPRTLELQARLANPGAIRQAARPGR